MNLKKLTRIILLVAVLLVLSIVPVNAVVFNAAFDSDFYVNCYPDLKAAFGNDANAAYNHYLTYGIKEGRIASPVFDAKAYIRNYPDLQAAFGDDYVAAYNHFLTNGMNEGRLASDSFNVQVYIANYPDLQAAFGNDVAGAYNHYLNYGMAEGRVCGALEAGAEAPEDHVHAYEISRVLITATCINDGEAVYKCECGDEKVDVIPASTEYHDYKEVESGAANVKIYKCTICNDTYSEVITDEAHEHDYVEIAGSKVEATCTTEGKIFKQCSDPECNDIIEEKIPMIDHVSSTPEGTGKITEGVTSCEKDGAEEVTCDVCRQKFIRPISAHKFEKVSETVATCTAEGVATYKCKACGETKVETTEKVEHTYTSPIAISDATCEKTGLSMSVCTVCANEKREVLPALGHSKEGLTPDLRYVDAKGKVVMQEDGVTPVAVEENIANGEKNCEYSIAEEYICVNHTNGGHCDKKEGKMLVVVTNAAGHRIDTTEPVTVGTIEYVAGEPVKENGKIVVNEGAKADCKHDEVKVFTCANCEEEQVVVITEKLAHKVLEGSTVVYGATCKADGYKTYTCTTCNEQVTEETGEKALGHNYVFVPETCTEVANIACTRCTLTAEDKASEGYTAFKDSLTAEQKAALGKPSADGHDPIGEIKVIDGVECKYCKKCGEWVPVSNNNNQDDEIDKSALDAKISALKGLVETDYTNWTAVQDAITAAQTIASTEGKTQAEFDAAVSAIPELSKKAVVDTDSKLANAEQKVQDETANSANYSNWDVFTAKVTAARQLLDNPETLQSVFDAAVAEIPELQNI